MQESRRSLAALKQLLEEHPVDEAGTALSRFLVIRTVGHVEFMFDSCIAHFAEAKSHPAISQYVKSGLFRGANPSPELLSRRLNALSAEWASDFAELMDADDGLFGRELSFMVDRRNKIAHGRSESVNRRKAVDLSQIGLDLGDWLVQCVDPST
jgi:hypothetical protein